MTLKEQIEKARKALEEQRLAEAGGTALSLAGAAKHVATKTVPDAIKGIVSAPIALAKFIHSPSAQAEKLGPSLEAYAYDRWQNPANALPEIGMIAGGAVGAPFGMPSVGAGLGAFLGVSVRNAIKDIPWTSEDVGTVVAAPLGNLPFAAASSIARVAAGTGRKTSAAETIYKSTRLTPDQMKIADDIIENSEITSMAKREVLVRDAQGVLAKDAEAQPLPALREEQLSLPFPANTSQMTQRKLFDKKDIAGQLSRIIKGKPDSDLPDRPNKAQLELFRAPEFKQGELFSAKERMAQPVLFPIRGSTFITNLDNVYTTPTETAQLPGNRFRQPRLFNDPAKMKQLSLFNKGRTSVPKPNVRALPALEEQLLLPLSRRTDIDPGPTWRGTRFAPKATAGEQLDLDLPKPITPIEIDQGELWPGTRLQSTHKDKLKQEELFPKQKLAPHWLSKAVAEERRQTKLGAARQQIQAHIAEQEARLRAEDTIKNNPRLAEMMEDERHLARISALTSQQLSPTANPFVKEARKAGILASFFNPHSNLAYKLGPEGAKVSQEIMEANDLHVTGTHKFRELAHVVMDKYSIKEHDLKSHGMMHVLFEHPDLRDVLRTQGTAGIKQWETATGNRLNVAPKDYQRLHEVGQFADELRTQVLDPMWYFAMKRNADPDTLGQYNMRYMLPTFTSRRVATEIESDLKSIDRAYSSLSEVEKKQEHGMMLLAQREALTNKLTVAGKYADKADKSRANASQTLYKKGMKPGEVFNSAYRDKHTDMMFGTGLRSSMDDYISGFMKKSVYDKVNASVNDTVRSAAWDPATKRWVTAFALDQLGTRRQVQTKRLAEKLQQIPIIGKHITEDSLNNAVDTLGAYNAAVNLGLNPKYYPIQAMQPLVMGYGIVGADGLAHGFMKVITDWPAAYKRAVNDGAVQSGLENLWREEGTTRRGHKITRFTNEALDMSNRGLRASEAMNRVWINESGHFIAGKEGLTGRDAVRRARDINRMVNHGFSSAERITASNTLYGSNLLRYKSFGMQTLSYMKHLMVRNPKAAAETAAMLLALGGTSGIPGFGMMQDQLARHLNYNMPTITPFDEVTGTDMSNSWSLAPSLPGLDRGQLNVQDALGPILGPLTMAPVGAVGTLLGIEGSEEVTGKALRGMIGGVPSRIASSLSEFNRGGLTKTDSGRPLIQRSTSDIVKSAAGFRQSPRSTAYKLKQSIMRAHEAGDMEGLKVAIAKARAGGLARPYEAITTSKRKATMEEKKRGTIDALLGR